MNLLLAFLLIAQFAHRQNPGVRGGTPPTIAALGTCPSVGCATVDTGGASVMVATITASGSCPGANCTLTFACSKDNWATSVAVAADSFTSGSMAGAPATTTTTTGTFIMPTFAFPQCGVYASSYTSGTATVYLDSDPAFLPAIGATGAASLQVQGAPIGVGNPVQTEAVPTLDVVGLTTVGLATVTTSQSVKASSGNLYGFGVVNGAGAGCWLQCVNSAGAGTLGTAVIFQAPLPTSATLYQPVGPFALGSFSTGIACGVASAVSGASACASAATGVALYIK